MIYTLTLNPAIDRELTVEEIEFDKVLSALEARIDFGVITSYSIHYTKLYDKEVEEKLPEVAAKLGEDLMWTNEAEEVLIEKFWQKPE